LSVAEPLRHKGRLEVHIKAQFLAVYTSKILTNENIFDPNVDRALIERMRECAYDIYIKSWQANKIRAETNEVNRAMRYKLQEEAILLCDEIHACIGIAKSVYHLRQRRMKYWSSLITEVRKLIQAWKESDADRYGQPQRNA
jgi:hypothetical protein